MAFIKVSGTAFPIYGTAIGAAAYLAGASHGAAWAAAEFANKNSALITAARILDRQAWLGAPTDPVDASDPENQPADTQPLQWPRSGLVDRNGVAISEDSIPLAVEQASYEIALALILPSPTVQTSSASASNVKRERTSERVEGAVSVESEVEYWREVGSAIVGSSRFPTIIHELIGLWLSGAAVLAPEVSGNDGCSFIQGQDLGYTGYGIP